MKVLLSAYACEPGGGSETGKGWEFAETLARRGCEVTVLTCGSHHREKIERHCATHDVPPNLDFVWHDVPGWPGPGYEGARHIRQHYLAWQFTARRTVKKLLAKRSFDVIHHLTWTVLRWPSFLGGLGPRFVFGPVGGGEVTPPLLRESFPEAGRKKERLRDIINRVSRLDPMVRSCLRKADVILCTDTATANHVPGKWSDKTFVVADIFAPELQPAGAREGMSTDGPALLFAGRLEYWKGAQLALGALAELRTRMPGARLTLAGSGPDEAFLHDQARQLGVEDAAHFLGRVPHEEMLKLYTSHDVFLFPSLHDSGPHAIGEALAASLPVVCLDLGGPGIAVDASCGAVVSTGGRSVAEIHADLADAVARIVSDPQRLADLRAGALARAAQFSYAARIDEMVRCFYRPEPVRDLGLLAGVEA
ncbi:glycosyltransferase family 4 protein [Tropicimonas isoalkanivorans]|uniref:glycosyltransferase family 4 protein n=1 Tax=Tropicimonas isoalkanivorans TaxID=441112 RepID=UPI0015A573BD|nr:glycosyltransferase family 4 protein [Tropicimonas isoalkanivorans]